MFSTYALALVVLQLVLPFSFSQSSPAKRADRIQHFDALAQSYCASRVPSSEWVFAVYRDCNNNAPTCNDICANYQTQMLTTINNDRTRTSCFDAFHVAKNNVDAFRFRTYSYGKTLGCSWEAGRCGPNYCCCQATS